MAKKLPRFTRAADGTLVYANTGRAAPPDLFTEGKTVYRIANNAVGRVKVGSLAGVGSLSKTQKQRVAAGARRRWRSAAPRGMEDIGPRATGELPKVRKRFGQKTPPEFTTAYPYTYEGMIEHYDPAAQRRVLSRTDRAAYNFAKKLQNLVEQGKLTKTQAEARWTIYSEGTEYSRDKEWDKLNEEFAGGQEFREGSP